LPDLKYYLGIILEGLRNNFKILQDDRFLGPICEPGTTGV
jgi:hypothetical protein